MAVPGPEPKPNKVGRTPRLAWTEVENKPYDGPRPKLPSKIMGARPLPEVKGWWDIVSKMPHCVLWEASDWLFAVSTLPLVTEFWSGGASVATMRELRIREDQMGLTLEARRKLRIRYVDDLGQAVEDGDAAQAAAVADLAARRRRLASAS